MHQLQCVLNHDPDPTDDLFFERVSQAIERLAAIGLFFDFEVEETLADGTQQLVWVERDDQAIWTMLKDGDHGVCYLLLEASRRGDLRKMLRTASEQLEVATFEGLQEAASSGLMRDPIALIRLAIAVDGRSPDAATLTRIRDAMRHRHPGVRLAAVQAAGLTGWSEFGLDLEALLKGEPNIAVNEAAQHAATACQRDTYTGACAYR